MNKEEVYNKVVDILVTDFRKNKEDILPDSKFKEDLQMDSLDKIDIIIALEAEYNVEIPESIDNKTKNEIFTYKTVQGFSDFITLLLQEQLEKK